MISSEHFKLRFNMAALHPVHTPPAHPAPMLPAAAAASAMTPNGPGSSSGSSGTALGADKVSFHKLGKKMVPRITLCNFDTGANGKVIHRDGTVLGMHIGASVPDSLKGADKIRWAIHLNHLQSAPVPPPVFVSKHLGDSHMAMQLKEPCEPNELWVNPSELGPDKIVYFKKQRWTLSTKFKELCGTKWPKFVLSASAHIGGNLVTEISEEFVVRSKEQSHKTRAARGLPSKVTKRRTPQTEKREHELRMFHSDITNQREAIQKLTSENDDMMARFEFMRCVLKSCRQEPNIARLVKECDQYTARAMKWKS